MNERLILVHKLAMDLIKEGRPVTVRAIMERSDLTKPSIYNYLNTLATMGILTDKEYTTQNVNRALGSWERMNDDERKVFLKIVGVEHG